MSPAPHAVNRASTSRARKHLPFCCHQTPSKRLHPQQHHANHSAASMPNRSAQQQLAFTCSTSRSNGAAAAVSSPAVAPSRAPWQLHPSPLWARAALVSAAGSLLLAVSGPSTAWGVAQPTSQQQAITGTAQVVDGDTLRVDGVKIRMFGVDAPETKQTCKDAGGRDYLCGQLSKDALQQHLGSRAVECKVVAQDIYGRSVSTCYLGGEDVNEWLVKNGYAVAYRQFSKDYIAAEDAAHAARLGVWQGAFQEPREWRKEHRNGGGSGGGGPSLAGVVPAAAATESIDIEDLMVNLGFGKAGGGCSNPQIKGNVSGKAEKIYHVPGGRYYDAVKIEPEKGEQLFCSPKDAEAAGFRASAA